MALFSESASFPGFQLCQQLSWVIQHSESQTIFSYWNLDLYTGFWAQCTKTHLVRTQSSLFLVFAINILFNAVFLTFLFHKLYVTGARIELISTIAMKMIEMPKWDHRYFSIWKREKASFFSMLIMEAFNRENARCRTKW